MPEQTNTGNSLAQGKYPWGFLKIGRQTANSFNRPPTGGLFLYKRKRRYKKFNTHDVEMSIPYCIHAEISQKSDIRSIADRDRKNFARTV